MLIYSVKNTVINLGLVENHTKIRKARMCTCVHASVNPV